MVQSEMSSQVQTKSVPPDGVVSHGANVHQHLHNRCGPVVSRIPLRVQIDVNTNVATNVASSENRKYYVHGIVPCDSFAMSQMLDEKAMMSKQGKNHVPLPTAAGTADAGAVAQQAQQYLEQNIMAWMQPKPQGQQILSSTLSSFVTSGTTGSHPLMSQKALQEHNQTQNHGGTRNPSQPVGTYSPIPSVAGTSCVGLPPSCSSIPHSLSFSGYSHHSLMQGTSFSSPCPSTFGAAQPSAAASFFARAAQRLNLSSKKRRRHNPHQDVEPPAFLTNFCDILRLSPPPVPPSLLKSLAKKENFSIGKVKVMLRIRGDQPLTELNSPFLNLDARKKQVTVFDPSAEGQSTPADRRTGVSAPKMFAFDAIFSPDDTQAEVCSSSLPDVIQAVVGGTDGCLFVYGQSKLGKTHTMVGGSDSVQALGVLPCAISWLFRLIHEQRQKTGARFSVRVSALELCGRNEQLRDLLSEYAAGTEGSGTSPGMYLKDDPIFGAQLINQSELRAPSAEKAGYLLDAALAARSRETEDEGRNSHFLFTLHLYQYRVERSGKGGVAGGRSRLHLFDLGSCDKIASKPRDGGCLSLSALGNVILALFNGQKHLPYKESKLTQLLKEAMSSLTCRVAMIAHVSSRPAHYAEILGTVQLASRVHRMRRKKIKYPNVPMDGADDKGGSSRPYVRMHPEDGVKSGNSDPDYTSSSEQSCDTVIYVGHLVHHDRDFTDNERPPSSLPVLPKSGKNQPQAKALLNPAAQESGTTCSLDRKRCNSMSKAHEQRKAAEDKMSHAQDGVKTLSVGADKQQGKRSPQLRHQPASTQTQVAENHLSKSAQSSPLHALKRAKHRAAGQSKQDTNTVEGDQVPGKAGAASSGKISKPPSDETWIDGPRFSKPKFDSKTLHQLQKEQWVDGPPNMYGFMDHHKQTMIQRWIEEHSKQTHGATKKKSNEVWIDHPADKSNPPKSVNSTPIKVGPSEDKTFSKDKKVSLNDCKTHKTDECKAACDIASNHDCEIDEMVDDDDGADTASNSADVDETDNEENAETSGYDADLHGLQLGESTSHGPGVTLCESLRGKFHEEDNSAIEVIEVMDPEEPVPMVDSCLQVNEEDIIAEYWFRYRSSENPLPEVDQSNCDSREHPLRILSEEDLNLPSSFTDSRSVSVDLDSISVPDTCTDGMRSKGGLTWRLLYGNMFQRIKEQQQRKRRTIEDMNLAANSEINEKLDRIAKLRELIQPFARHRTRIQQEALFKTCPVGRIPASGSRGTMSEMICASQHSSMEDLSEAEITSTQSEPADLDIDKYDYKLNIKPMNGLKLEAFYNKIHKIPPFLEQYQKPTQVVPPLTYEQEKMYLLNQMETQRTENTAKYNNDSKHYSSSSLSRFDTDTLQKPFSTNSLKLNHSTSPIHKHTFGNSIQKLNTSENSIDQNCQIFNKDVSSISELNKRTLERKESKKVSLEMNEISKRPDSKGSPRILPCKNIDTTQLTVGQSPSISSKSRSHRSKSKIADIQGNQCQQILTQASSSSLWSKDSSTVASPKASYKHPTAVPNHSPARNPNKYPNGTSIPVKSSRALNTKLPARSSPTSSSTSGVTTMCCASMKQKDKTVGSKCKSKQATAKESRKSHKANSKSLCRSTSSPSTCVDSGDTLLTDFTDSEYHAARHASISGALASPYHKVPQVHISHHHHHHQRTSSGHGSESSVNSIEPSREAKELLLKGTKTQQFSGTSSGYESILRDSEGTPLSSSQESGNEDSVDKGDRSRKGRKKSQGSSRRSLSAPARSPPSPLGAPPPLAVSQQPISNSRACQMRRGDMSMRRSEEEVCCTGLLCCRLLDFY